MSAGFAFLLVLVAGIVSLTFVLGPKLPASHLVTAVWLAIGVSGFVLVAQGYLVAAFRLIDSRTAILVAVPAIGLVVASIAGCLAWLRNSSLNSSFRVLALTLLAFDFAALGVLAAGTPF